MSGVTDSNEITVSPDRASEIGGSACTDCGRTHWMKAHGTNRWHHRIAARLPRGRYMIHRRAVDAAGNREKMRTRHLRIR